MNNLKNIIIFTFCLSINNVNGQLSQFCSDVSQECTSEILDFAQLVLDSEDSNCDQFTSLFGDQCNINCTNAIMIHFMLIGTLDYDFGNISSGPTEEPFNFVPSLAVSQGIVSRSLKVCGNSWCDYVFDKDYNLLSIEEVESFVNEKGHLPGFKTQQEYENEKVIGIEDITLKQQEKIEELFLHLIEFDKEVDELLAKN